MLITYKYIENSSQLLASKSSKIASTYDSYFLISDLRAGTVHSILLQHLTMFRIKMHPAACLASIFDDSKRVISFL